MENYLLFLTFVLIAVATPGPAVFITVKNSIAYGFGIAIIGILGNITGLLFMATLSSLGLGAVILASSTLFYMMKLLGGIYLIYLGVKLWKSSFKPIEKVTLDKKRFSMSKVYKEALFVALSNPKAIAFCTALFPQFIQLDKPFFHQFFILTITFLLGSFLFLSFYALLALKAQKYLQKEQTLSWFHRITGGIFIGFGSFLATP